MRGFGLFRNLFKSEVKQPSERRQETRVDAREGLRILVVDDSATVVAVLGRMLNQARYDAYAADSGEAALESLHSSVPELVFLDIVLPGMSGFAVLRALRRDPRTAHVPVIMISGNLKATEEFYGQRIGADDFMKKPFGRTEVFTRIQRLVENGRLPAREISAEEEGNLEELVAEETVPADHQLTAHSAGDIAEAALPDDATADATLMAPSVSAGDTDAPITVDPSDTVDSGTPSAAPAPTTPVRGTASALTAAGWAPDDAAAGASAVVPATGHAAPGADATTPAADPSVDRSDEPIVSTPVFDDSPFPDPLEHASGAAASDSSGDVQPSLFPDAAGRGNGLDQSGDAADDADAAATDDGEANEAASASPGDHEDEVENLHPALRPEVRDPDSKLIYEPPWERD